MINKKTVLALITARGGSKGIPNKNIKPLAGKPLIQWTIEAAQKSIYIDRLILSSDSHEIIGVAKYLDCDIPFVRPSELAKDTSGSMDVIIHAVGFLKEKYDYILLLQPTSPFRSTRDIDGIIKYINASDAKMVVSVSKLKKHPMFMFEIKENKLVPIIGYSKQLRRQDMPSAYEHNGALYIARTDYLLQTKTFNAIESVPFITEGQINIDIDTPNDWEYAEYLIKNNKIL